MMMNLKHQQGLSIVELMIGILLSLILLTGVVQLYVSNSTSQRVLHAASRMQEAGRFSIDFASREIRMAGFTGCARIGNTGISFNNIADAGFGYDADGDGDTDAMGFIGTNAVSGFDNVTSPLDDELTDMGLSIGAGVGQVVAGTDVIVIKGSRSCPGGNIVQQMNLTSANIKIKDADLCNITQNSLVLVSDCSSADLFVVSNNPNSNGVDKSTLAHGNNVNHGTKLSKSYGLDAAVYQMYVTALYIGNGAAGQPALFQTTTTGGAFTTLELVDGVTDMQIEYGEDTDDDFAANYYVTADNVTNMDNVVSTHVSFLVRSNDDNLSPEQVQYSFNRALTTAGDNRLYQPYTATVTLRNRVK